MTSDDSQILFQFRHEKILFKLDMEMSIDFSTFQEMLVSKNQMIYMCVILIKITNL